MQKAFCRSGANRVLSADRELPRADPLPHIQATSIHRTFAIRSTGLREAPAMLVEFGRSNPFLLPRPYGVTGRDPGASYARGPGQGACGFLTHFTPQLVPPHGYGLASAPDSASRVSVKEMAMAPNSLSLTFHVSFGFAVYLVLHPLGITRRGARKKTAFMGALF